LTAAAVAADIPAMPLRLSDAQLDMIMHAAAVLAPADRSPFLREVAALLQGREVGDGSVPRACADAWAKFWDPPQLERAKGTSKWR
jgi:hypothetical protein